MVDTVNLGKERNPESSIQGYRVTSKKEHSFSGSLIEEDCTVHKRLKTSATIGKMIFKWGTYYNFLAF